MDRLLKIKSEILTDDKNVIVHIDNFNWLMEKVETLKKIEGVMGLSHADSFNKVDAIDEIIDILEYW